ncbi:MAG: hypothetical protein HY712_04690 [candidate division NC10 bacterium]|nr:hypothetical protein [candidate division NC10 bacterium]
MRKIMRSVLVLGLGLLIVPFLADLQRPFSTVESGVAYAKGGGGGGGSRGGSSFGSNRGGFGSSNSGPGSLNSGRGSSNSGPGSVNSGPGSVNSGRISEGEAPRGMDGMRGRGEAFEHGVEIEVEGVRDAFRGPEPELRGRVAEGEAPRGLD